MISVGITTENQYVVAATIPGFINAQRAHNEFGIRSRNTHMNGSNTGGIRQDAATVNHPEHMGGQNSSNRYGMSQISYNHFGNIIN